MNVNEENTKLLNKIINMCDGDYVYLSKELNVSYHRIKYWIRNNKISDKGLYIISNNQKYSKLVSAKLKEYIDVKCR
jgi:hypothetical protein